MNCQAMLYVTPACNDTVRLIQLAFVGLAFLTALPRKNDIPFAPYDKVLWARKYFRGIPVLLGPYSQ